MQISAEAFDSIREYKIHSTMTNIMINNASYTLESYQEFIDSIVNKSNKHAYEEKMVPYIENNVNLDTYIQENITLNKKFFNAILKTKIKTMGLITEPWCLDACIILPILRAISIINSEISIKLYCRDQNEDLMNQFLTNGSKSIPIVFGLDNNENQIFRWGPRSIKASKAFEPHRNDHYSIKSKILTDFFKSDLTMDLQEEWIDRMN